LYKPVSNFAELEYSLPQEIASNPCSSKNDRFYYYQYPILYPLPSIDIFSAIIVNLRPIFILGLMFFLFRAAFISSAYFRLR
jgi:hypothetical protein